MLYCRFCGANLPDNSRFCTHCGQAQNPGTSSEEIANTSAISNAPGLPGELSQVVPPLLPLIDPGQLPASSTPMVWGTPQASAMPMTQGTPSIQHPDPSYKPHQYAEQSPAPAHQMHTPHTQHLGKVLSQVTAGSGSRIAMSVVAKWSIIGIVAIVVVAGIARAIPSVFHLEGGTTSAPITQPVPPTQTSCPAAGMARAAVTAPLALGKDQNVVYFEDEPQSIGNQPDIGVLNRYDVTTGRTTQIVRISNMHITEAQVSADGQWVLFAGNAILPNSPLLSKLQMVRMDGQGLQTLYCITADVAGTEGIYNVQWSPDQKMIVFDQDKEGTPGRTGSLYLIDVMNGQLQLEIVTPTYNLGDQPVTWLDNTRVFMYIFGNAHHFLILDTKRGANQQVSDLQPFVTSPFPCENIDRFVTSYDGTKLFLGQCTSEPNLTPIGPYSISMQPIGGTPHTIYTSPTLFAGEIRMISSTSLLLFISDHSSSTQTSQDGLWTMNIDGSNLKEVISFSELDKAIGATDPSFQNELIDNQFTRYPWSNFSRNGNMYTIQTWLLTRDPPCKLLVGSLSGGSFTTVVSSNSSCDFDYAFNSSYGIGRIHLGMVGWTTM